MTHLEYEIVRLVLMFSGLFCGVLIACAIGLWWLGPEDD